MALGTAASSRDARIAGALYVAWLIMGVVRAIYVPLTLFGGGAAASTARILEHEATFRFAMVTDLATAVLTLFLVLALYRGETSASTSARSCSGWRCSPSRSLRAE